MRSAAATALFRWLLPIQPAIAREVVMPHLETAKESR